MRGWESGRRGAGPGTRVLPCLDPARRSRGPWIVALTLVASLLSVASVCAREYPPQAPPPKPLVLPAPTVRALPNGLKVVVVERHTLPLMTLRMVVRSGAEAEPDGLPGTAELVSALLTEGTARRSEREIAEAVDSVGGLIDSGADWDSSFVTLSVLTDQMELAFDLLSDMVMHPAFAPAEVERKRQQTLSALEVVHGDPAYVADTALRGKLFAGTPYSHPEDGTVETIRRITPGALRDFHARFYRPANCILAVVGDISAREAFERAEKAFGAWENRPGPAAPPEAMPAAGSRRSVAIDKPDAVQTEIRIGSLGVPRNSPDYFALSVANQILGGPAANRLFRALRTREGLTYGASSDLVCHRTLGAWVAKTFTRTPETIKSVQVALDQMRHLRDHGITDQELETAQGYLIGHLALEFETSDGMASRILELMIHNLPLEYWNRFPDKIRALTAQEVSSATRRYLDPDRNIIVLVGNLSGFKKELKKLGPVQVILLDDVDFGSPDLERPGAGKR
jgi:zinc protease